MIDGRTIVEHAANWLFAFFVHALVLRTLALALVAKVTSPAVRCWLWRGVLFAPVLTATSSVLLQGRGVGQYPSVSALLRPHVPATWRPVRVDVDERVTRTGVVERTVTVRDPVSRTLSLVTVILASVGSVVGVSVWFVQRRVATRRLAGRERIAIDSPAVRAAGVVVSCAPTVDVPLVLSGREICVPQTGFFDLPKAHRESILLHELAHVVRGDAAWLQGAKLLTASTRWALLGGHVARALRRDTELAADDHALARGAEPAALVAALAAFAARLERRDALDPLWLGTVGGVPLAASDSDLVVRARRILGPPMPRARAWARAAISVAGMAAVAGVALAPVPVTAVPSPSRPSLVDNGARVVEIVEDDVRLGGERRE